MEIGMGKATLVWIMLAKCKAGQLSMSVNQRHCQKKRTASTIAKSDVQQ